MTKQIASKLHNEAMDMTEAIMVLSHGTAMKESVAARLIEASQQPTHAVFHRSAAVLCANAGMLDTAEEHIKEGLEGEPPDEIVEELEQVRELVELYRRMMDENEKEVIMSVISRDKFRLMEQSMHINLRLSREYIHRLLSQTLAYAGIEIVDECDAVTGGPEVIEPEKRVISREKFRLIKKILSQVLSDAGIEIVGECDAVGPEPILPGITQGELIVKEGGGAVKLLTADGRLLLYQRGYAKDGCPDHVGRTEVLANAKLHAAAPDMAKVIKGAYDHFTMLNPDESTPLLDDFRNVLRMAGVDV